MLGLVLLLVTFRFTSCAALDESDDDLWKPTAIACIEREKVI